MDAEQIVKIRRACQYRVVQTASSYWVLMDGAIALNVPTLEDVYPTREEIREVLQQGARAVRFCTTGPWEPMAFEFLLTADPYDLSAIKQKARNQTRRSLERCEVLTPSESDLMERVFEINSQTLGRQGRRTRFLSDKDIWRDYVRALGEVEDVFAYGSYVDGVMVAYVLAMRIKQRIVLYHPFLDRAYSKHYPMNGLVYTAVNATRSKVGSLPVSYGFGSMWGIDSLDHFKIGMGCEKVPRLRITVLRGLLGYAVQPRLGRVLNQTPMLGARIGAKYNHIVKEKQLGMKWWQNPTTFDQVTERSTPVAGSNDEEQS